MGVDIFLVISGFLITKIIHTELEDKTFTLKNFYERRIKRIFPAFIVVLLCSTIAAYFLFLPSELLDYVQSALSSIFFSSNILFYTEAGYFDATAELKPLLHTWSLAVEEQFYIVFPLLLIALMKLKPEFLKAFIVILFTASILTNCLFAYWKNPEAIFYMLPLRAWELLVGAIIALRVVPVAWVEKKHWAQLFSLVGLGLIVWGLTLETDQDEFYFIDLMPVVFGTGLIIYAGQTNTDIWVSRAFSLKPAVFFGKISYSLYLWHWPLYVYSKYYMFDYLPKPHKAGLIVLSVVLAYLSWRFVEQPMRSKTLKITSSTFMRFGFVSIIAICTMCLALAYTQGRAHWHNPAILKIANAELGNDYQFIETFNKDNDFVFGSDGSWEDATFVILGDSHGQAIAPAFEKKLKAEKQTGLMFRNRCLIYSALFELDADLRRCEDQTRAALVRIVNDERVKVVVLVQRWAARTKDWYTKHRMSKEQALTLREKSLLEIVTLLKKTGKRVLIVAQPPRIEHSAENIPSIYARMRIRDSAMAEKIAPTLELYYEQQKDIFPILKSVQKKTGVQVIWPHKTLCSDEAGSCALNDDGGFFYYDDDHLSKYGAEKLSDQIHLD